MLRSIRRQCMQRQGHMTSPAHVTVTARMLSCPAPMCVTSTNNNNTTTTPLEKHECVLSNVILRQDALGKTAHSEASVQGIHAREELPTADSMEMCVTLPLNVSLDLGLVCGAQHDLAMIDTDSCLITCYRRSQGPRTLWT